MNNLSEEMRGKIPPGLLKVIEEKKMKKQEEENAHMTPEERKKKEEEEEKNLANKNQNTEKKLNESTENLSQQAEQLVGRNNLNRFQELSAENKESNQEMINFLNRNQGTYKGVAR